jgi:hypothetical protein
LGAGWSQRQLARERKIGVECKYMRKPEPLVIYLNFSIREADRLMKAQDIQTKVLKF